jgi:hypothetical protein
MCMIAFQHLYEGAGVVRQAANPALRFELVQVVGELPGRSPDRPRDAAHGHVDERADWVPAQVPPDQLDGQGRPDIACDRR